MSFCTTFGADSTSSFASFSPRPATARTSLMTLIFDLASKPRSFTSKAVFSSTASAGSAPPSATVPPAPPGVPNCPGKIVRPRSWRTIAPRALTSSSGSATTVSYSPCSFAEERPTPTSSAASVWARAASENERRSGGAAATTGEEDNGERDAVAVRGRIARRPAAEAPLLHRSAVLETAGFMLQQEAGVPGRGIGVRAFRRRDGGMGCGAVSFLSLPRIKRLECG
mmetsp:Transcript_118653/g.242529  ORF Transcript_118653/g.242529 Transcript_118653/m.242529 type:complete len:226 (+) Transcript_118653:1367-2044(+)